MFETDQEVRVKASPDQGGKVLSQQGRLVVVQHPDGSEQRWLAKDLEAVVHEEASAFVAGDLVTSQGRASKHEMELLVGEEHKLVWLTSAGRGPGANSRRVELRRLDDTYVTTVAIGAVSAEDIALAMPYLQERYFMPQVNVIGLDERPGDVDWPRLIDDLRVIAESQGGAE